MKSIRVVSLLLLCIPNLFGLQSPTATSQKSAKKTSTATNKPVHVQSSDLAAAQHLLDNGQLDEALKATEALSRQQPEPPDVEFLRGKSFYLKADFQNADSAFQKAIAQDSTNREAVQLRGATLFRMGKPAEAIPLLEQSHGNMPRLNLDGTYVLALCYLNTHRFDESRRSFAALYHIQPDAAPAYLLLGTMLLRWKNPSAAQEMAQKAIALNPRLAEAHYLVGQVALAGGRVDEALTEFEHEAAINPLFGPVYDRLGDVYLQKNQYEKAQDALNQAILLEPDATGPYILLGQVLLKRENSSTAIVYLKRATEMDPSNELSHYLLGQAYRNLGRIEEAKVEFQTVAKLKGQSTRPHR
jgi:tetratricopeptide (TPR) repeat protein